MSKMISVASGFQYSVNIGYDLNNDDKLKNFIPTKSALTLLKDILSSTALDATERARVLVGAYGKGKSHIILTILSVLMQRDRSLFTHLMPKINEDPELKQLVDNYYSDKNNRILPVIINGTSGSLPQAFLLALQRTLDENGLDIMPDTNYRAAINTIQKWKADYPKTYDKFKKEISLPVDAFISELNDYNATIYSEFEEVYPKLTSGSIFNPFELHEYQKKAIAAWVGENYRGIFDMATGTGKTYTGLGAISKLSEDLNDDLAVIVVAPYKHLVEQWVEDIVKFNMKPIIAYGDPAHKDWRKKFSKAIIDQKIRRDKRFLCVVTTNVTFASPDFQERIDKIKSPILLVVDEAHNFGARSYAKHLDDRFAYRLALSATLERHRDDEGTALLCSFFGKKCIEYPLERAIDEDKLTPYKYYPILVYLSELELESYEQLSYEMSKCMIKDKHGKYKLNKRGKILALKRSRVVAGAMQKLEALKREITPYKDDNNILVYCGATRVIDDSDTSSDDENDIRQIEAVTKILGNELNMSVARFTSEENMEERALIKEHFQDGGKLQAIVAIKCLDEGVNIPGIRTAFILASTTNPKEYIQRRGRVLRKADNKPFAEIYDFVTLPRPLDSVSGLTIEQANRDKTLVKNELARIKEFGRLALNSMLANNLIWDIQEAYHLNDTDLKKEGEDFE